MNTYILGTAVKFTVILNVDTATSAKITIKDESDITKIDAVNMTKEADKVYSYIFQSDDDYDEGEYEITITVVYNTYTSIKQTQVNFVDQ